MLLRTNNDCKIQTPRRPESFPGDGAEDLLLLPVEDARSLNHQLSGLRFA